MTWIPLVGLSAKRAHRRYGPVAARCQQLPELSGEGPPTWVLHRRVLRSVLRELPRGHQPLKIASVGERSRRLEKAARAHERLLAAHSRVPGHGHAGERFLLWSSPVTRPEGVEPPSLAISLDVRAKEIPQAVCELWAGLFLYAAEASAEVALRRLEIAVLLTPFSEAAAAQLIALQAERPLHATPGPVRLPLPGEEQAEPSLLELERSLVRYRLPVFLDAVETSLGVRLSALRRRELQGVIETRAFSADHSAISDPGLKATATDLLGPPAAFDPEPAPLGLRDWPRFVLSTGRNAAAFARLQERTSGVEAGVRRRCDWLAEVELALLPDDGLRRTLEEQIDLLRKVTRLSAEAEVFALQQARGYSRAMGIGVTSLDAGLSTSALAILWDFRSLAEQLRSSAAGPPQEAPLAADSALRAFFAEHPELYPQAAAPSSPARAAQPRLGQGASLSGCRVAELALQQLLSVDELPSLELMLERARVHLDQRLALAEAKLPRLLLPRLSGARSLVNDSVKLRERVRMAEVRADHLLRTVVGEIDRRLPGLDHGLRPGSSLHCSLAELRRAVDLSGTSLRGRVKFRAQARMRWQAALEAPAQLRFEDQLLARARTLAERRGLTQLPLLLAQPARVRYPGRTMDTLPTIARSLGISLPGGGEETPPESR